MTSKMHPTTIRLTESEQTFLAMLKVEGATSISDKVRALLNEKRQQQQAGRSYRSALELSSALVGPLSKSVKLAEDRLDIHSEFVQRTLAWTPEFIGKLLAAQPFQDDEGLDREKLLKLEENLSNQFCRLLGIILQSYISRESALYGSNSISADQLKPLVRLCKLAEGDFEKLD